MNSLSVCLSLPLLSHGGCGLHAGEKRHRVGALEHDTVCVRNQTSKQNDAVGCPDPDMHKRETMEFNQRAANSKRHKERDVSLRETLVCIRRERRWFV